MILLKDLAKEMKIKCGDLIENLKCAGIEKGAMSKIDDDEVGKLKEKYYELKQIGHDLELSGIGDLPSTTDANKEDESTTEEDEIIFETPRKASTKPWEPSVLLDIPKRFKNPHFVYRFVNKDKPGNIRKKEQEGWEIDQEVTRLMKKHGGPTINDGGQNDSTMQIRELIVMRLPKDRAEARRRLYSPKKVEASKEELNQIIKPIGSYAFGETKEDVSVGQRQ